MAYLCYQNPNKNLSLFLIFFLSFYFYIFLLVSYLLVLQRFSNYSVLFVLYCDFGTAVMTNTDWYHGKISVSRQDIGIMTDNDQYHGGYWLAYQPVTSMTADSYWDLKDIFGIPNIVC